MYMTEEISHEINELAIRSYRLQRTREQLSKHNIAAAILTDPVNIRYATGSRNMQIWTARNMVRYAFVPAEGPVVLFENGNAFHLAKHLETIAEIRQATSLEFGISGERFAQHAGRWADEIIDLFHQTCGKGARLGIDTGNLMGILALQSRGIQPVDAKCALDIARSIKSADEIMAIRSAMVACTEAVTAMRDALKPGVTERELLAILNKENIARGGEHQETKLLSSGERTNPWFTEASDRVIGSGDLVIFDTDLIGKHGIFADQSRSWVVDRCKPSDHQRRLYAMAHEEMSFNASLIRPGVTFLEVSQQSWRVPEPYVANRYAEIVHGLGLAGEYPLVYYPQDADQWQYSGHFEENMVVCVESYVGAENGEEGIKLEQPYLVTKNGAVPIESYQIEEEYL
ncbi:MAG: Xaa-Pro peptidase family protein [Proteobacteria bacterium]|nr:Xaa-Pro peptidase family protein [Pseudomonadota bacterium]